MIKTAQSGTVSIYLGIAIVNSSPIAKTVTVLVQLNKKLINLSKIIQKIPTITVTLINQIIRKTVIKKDDGLLLCQVNAIIFLWVKNLNKNNIKE